MEASNAISIVKDFIDAANRHETWEVMSFLADEAVIKVEPPLPGMPLESYRGKELIQAWLSAFEAEHWRIDPSNLQMAGNEVIWDNRISADRFARMGIDPIQARGRATVEHNQITALTFTLDQASVKKIQAALVAQQR